MANIFSTSAYKAKRTMRASKQPHSYKGSSTIVEYTRKNGGKTYYESHRGSNQGKKITLYSSPSSRAKGKFGAIVRITKKENYHADSLGALKSKLGL